jgi:hypothetical protein
VPETHHAGQRPWNSEFRVFGDEAFTIFSLWFADPIRLSAWANRDLKDKLIELESDLRKWDRARAAARRAAGPWGWFWRWFSRMLRKGELLIRAVTEALTRREVAHDGGRKKPPVSKL